jgi:hypothetical protein
MSGVRRRGAPGKVALALGLLVVVAVGPFVAQFSAQPASRYALTAALAEHHTVDLSAFKHDLGVDHALYNGHLRSDKAPGESILGVPFYQVGRWFGAQSDSQLRGRGDLGMWWQTLWMAVIPFAVLLALMYLLCERFASRGAALAVALCLGFGTMMLPLADNLYGHILAALFGFGAWMMLERPGGIDARRAAIAGALAAAAVSVEYETGIIFLVLAAVVLVRARRRVGWFALGAAGPFAIVAWYQWRAFGAPWHTPSTYYAGSIEGTTRGGYHIPSLGDTWSVLFGIRGLLIGAPIALLAIPVCIWIWRRPEKFGTDARRHAIVALAVMIPYLVLVAGWSGLPILEEPGPRYIIPALPFLAVPLAVAWKRVWKVGALATAFGALIAIPAATTYLIIGIGENAINALPRRMLHGHFSLTIWSMAFGPFGVVVYLVSVAACIALLVHVARSPDAAAVAPGVDPQPVVEGTAA